ncbi:MAG: hypothetical protein KY466_12025 [Gemmatimonadetes bacterium]|nr:hypothetical protein [Gemmatimonadota bacterium]
MHPQLEVLLQIQDLKAQKRELEEAGGGRQVQEEQFKLDVPAALEALDGKIEELEGDLDPPVRRRYERMASGITRVVAPAINGTCYGCFVSVATSVASDRSERNSLRSCDNCGRFLYFVS